MDQIFENIRTRRSVREFLDKRIAREDLETIVQAGAWAPTAMNKQEIDVYVCLQEGAYLYHPKANSLEPVTKEDLRPAVGGGQGFVATAPVCLVMVADLSKFGGEVLMPALDAGIVSQNISLFCSGTGLVTVPRASMDQAKLKSGLKLKDTQRPLINHPVGYAK